jgi:hypothetical protein
MTMERRRPLSFAHAPTLPSGAASVPQADARDEARSSLLALVAMGTEPFEAVQTLLGAGAGWRDLAWAALALPEPAARMGALAEAALTALAAGKRGAIRSTLAELGVSPLSVAFGLWWTADRNPVFAPQRRAGVSHFFDMNAARALAKGLGVAPAFADRIGRDGGVWLRGMNLAGLPPGFTLVPGNLELINVPIPVLPDGLKVGGDLLLSGSGIQSLPPGLVVQGDLDLRRCAVWDGLVPGDAQVMGKVYDDARWTATMAPHLGLTAWRASRPHGGLP